MPRPESNSDVVPEDMETEQDAELGWETDVDFPLVTEGLSEQESPCNEPEPKPYKDPKSFIVTVGCMLLFMKNPRSNSFQMMMGVYLRGLSAPKRLIQLLSTMGLSISYTSTTRCLKALSRNCLHLVRKAAHRRPVYFLYDNFNRKVTHRHQRVDNKDFFESATTGTIVEGEALGEDRPLSDPPVKPMVFDFAIKANDTRHYKRVFSFHLAHGLPTKHHNPFSTTHDIPTIRQLELKPTVAYELPAMDIDQASVAGNLQILDRMRLLLAKSKASFKNVKMVIAGDQLTVSRIQTIQERNICEATYFDQMQWAIPVLQLFHMQMILCATILNTHFGSVSEPGALSYYIPLLARRQLNRDMPCYHTADEFLRVIYRAMVRKLWQATTAAHHGDHNSMSEEIFRQEIDSIVEDLTVKSASLFDKYSIANANAILFIRDMVVYIEFCASIKAGDTGRIEEILKRITLMFQAGKHINYGNELLRLGYNIRHKWGTTRKNAIFSSLLMNTTGLKNHWIPSDLYQEHNNLLTKQTHAIVGNKWSAMSYITPIVRLFQEVTSKIDKEFGTPKNSTFHRATTMDNDIEYVIRSLTEYDILGKDPHPDDHQKHPYPKTRAADLMKEGFEKLVHGGFDKFIQRMDEEQCGENLAKDRDLEKLMEELDVETNRANKYIEEAFN
ncbi:hypothetical protein BGZ72_001532 [Mortierella alpina]|nr:hypothetical protein BGZ72_001532 [Mortierella alpina]